jgi:hypothetical protein
MNTLWLDQKFASLIGTQLEQFKITKAKPFSAKFRCNICGDSSVNKFKTRGNFYEKNGHINFKCFNCGYSTSLSKFIKQFNPSLYYEYRLEIMKEAGLEEPKQYVSDISKFPIHRIDKFDPFKEIPKVSQLKEIHPAKVYIVSRNIPSHVHWRIYYVDKYYHWVNSIVDNKFSEKSLKKDEERIVLPFIDSNGYVFGFTGRAINPDSKVRYSTIMLDDTKGKIFGLNTVDKKKRIYVVEGPIDSMFLDNCVAMTGADADLSELGHPSNIVVIYDNEPRSAEIVKRISKAIDLGYNVCIWPDRIEQKDINDMININKLDGPSVQHIIDHNTFNGLSAKMRLNNWKKI